MPMQGLKYRKFLCLNSRYALNFACLNHGIIDNDLTGEYPVKTNNHGGKVSIIKDISHYGRDPAKTWKI